MNGDAPSKTETEVLGQSPSKPSRLSDDVAYWAPMLAFMLLTMFGGSWKNFYPFSYVVKTVVVAALLFIFWSRYSTIRWSQLPLGIACGVAGCAQWIGMQLWLESNFEFFKPSEDSFDPTSYFSNTLSLVGFLAVRIAGAVLVVPVMEELFWRDFLWRAIVSPDGFKQVAVGVRDPRAIALVCLAFACVHGHCWLTSIVWAALIAWLLVRTQSLGACIVAHATTNLLLAAYVLWTRDWSFW